jgi:prophage regulatory protein
MRHIDRDRTHVPKDSIEARLIRDPGQLTLGELLLERGMAAREIQRLKAEIACLRQNPVQAIPASPFVIPSPADAIGKLLRLSDVSERYGISRSLIYSLMAAGAFPQSIRVSARAVRWSQADLDLWEQERRAKPK